MVPVSNGIEKPLHCSGRRCTLHGGEEFLRGVSRIDEGQTNFDWTLTRCDLARAALTTSFFLIKNLPIVGYVLVKKIVALQI